MATIWGFDLGVTSIGFAIVTTDPDAPPQSTGRIERLGVRIFPECREEQKHEPKNAARRKARLARRQTRRRRWRRVKLRATLAEAGLLPTDTSVPPPGQDPYELRALGLSAPLAPHQLGWAMFHLLKRRGFLGSRKHGDRPADAEKENDVKSRPTLTPANAHFR